ncbi:MAG TPA: FixH family protein [Alphaproteobacteria bacterium]|nr:FixH family protein [Alphaproteobacteria bacterium]
MHKERQDTFADKLIPYYFVAFFVGLAVLFGWFIQLALGSYTGLVTEHAYEKGIDYNTTIAKAAAQDALGWQAKVTHTADAVTLTVMDAEGQALSGADVSLWLFRPVQAALDLRMPMAATAAGVYTAELDLPQRGLWEARILVKTDKAEYQTSKRMVFE